MYTLAHISDPHLGPLPAVRRRELLSKRITGFINWHRQRSHHLADGTLVKLVHHMKAVHPDHIAVTGDLVNLALDQELVAAREWLHLLGSGHDVSVVPGNHDAYVGGALEKAVSLWHDYLVGDGGSHDVDFPYWRERGPLVIVGVSTAIATAPFLATGRCGKPQLVRLAGLLDAARADGRFVVVLIHHPPQHDATPRHKRLLDAAAFRAVVAAHGVDLILHGHTHLNTWTSIPGPQRDIPVVCVPSASQGPGGRRPAAAYNLFGIDGSKGNWSCHARQFGLLPDGVTISLLEERYL